MPLHPLAGQPVPLDRLIDVDALRSSYGALVPDPGDPAQRVQFGTSGHRGTAGQCSFNEAHVAAISQAVCAHRAAAGIDGPLFLGIDTHALSEPAQQTALEVLAAHGVEVRLAAAGVPTPTPLVSHAILTHNRGRASGLADGIVITPSHNPPEDGGFKYNPPHGGPAGPDITGPVQDHANRLLEAGLQGVRRIPWARARAAATTRVHDFVGPYVEDLAQVLDMDAIAGAGLRLGVDPLGGAGIACWGPIADRYRLDLTVTNPALDPTFAFMRLDHDGKVRMDCSSPSAMAGLVGLRGRFDVAFANDPDADRHGIVTPTAGLMNPNHFLAAAVSYLFQNRPAWAPGAVVGKTLVSSAMIDRVAEALGRRVMEVPVGFKWFVDGLLSGTCAFGGEESAGASFLRRDGGVWTTDKDGILLGLLAAEMTARLGRDPGETYLELTERFGAPAYERLDAPATRAEKAALKALTPAHVTAKELAGEPIEAVLTRAPGNGAEIGGLKVVTRSGWFAARPSGTEDLTKIYAESFQGTDHLRRIQHEAQTLVAAALAG